MRMATNKGEQNWRIKQKQQPTHTKIQSTIVGIRLSFKWRKKKAKRPQFLINVPEFILIQCTIKKMHRFSSFFVRCFLLYLEFYFYFIFPLRFDSYPSIIGSFFSVICQFIEICSITFKPHFFHEMIIIIEIVEFFNTCWAWTNSFDS